MKCKNSFCNIVLHLQVELFAAETMKKEALPNLKITSFLRQEVSYICAEYMYLILITGQGSGLPCALVRL